jgi:hypothetical protein
MSIDIMATPYKFNKLQRQGFDMALGYWFWNIAVMIAPYDTGATRSAILLKRNKPRNIKIAYDLFRANWVQFLEEGQGPVKQYKDFIKKDTAEAIAEQLVSWIITGKRPSYAIRGVKPFVKLRKSKHAPFSIEKSFLKQANMNANVLTAKTRMQISKIREVNYLGNKQTITGQRPTTKTSGGYKKFNRNISNLQRIYKERVSQIQK